MIDVIAGSRECTVCGLKDNRLIRGLENGKIVSGFER